MLNLRSSLVPIFCAIFALLTGLESAARGGDGQPSSPAALLAANFTADQPCEDHSGRVMLYQTFPNIAHYIDHQNDHARDSTETPSELAQRLRLEFQSEESNRQSIGPRTGLPVRESRRNSIGATTALTTLGMASMSEGQRIQIKDFQKTLKRRYGHEFAAQAVYSLYLTGQGLFDGDIVIADHNMVGDNNRLKLIFPAVNRSRQDQERAHDGMMFGFEYQHRY